MSPDVLAQRAFKPIIVIDPGHGGHDSGAMKNGAVEKDITLAFSKILAKKLNATGRFKVMMTRDEDVFIPLGDRISFGEKNKANLFIAVHCDYADTGSTASGATIYSLRDSVADSLRRSTRGDVASKVLSKNEVEKVKQASDGEDVSLVKGILSDLAEREVDATQDRTSVFARTVIETMGASTTMRNKPDQQASFRVLEDGPVPLGADRARLRHQQAGCSQPAVRRLARQGHQLDPHRHRQLLLQSGCPAADVRRAAKPRNKKGRSRQDRPRFFVAKLGRTPVSG